MTDIITWVLILGASLEIGDDPRSIALAAAMIAAAGIIQGLRPAK